MGNGFPIRGEAVKDKDSSVQSTDSSYWIMAVCKNGVEKVNYSLSPHKMRTRGHFMQLSHTWFKINKRKHFSDNTNCGTHCHRTVEKPNI